MNANFKIVVCISHVNDMTDIYSHYCDYAPWYPIGTANQYSIVPLWHINDGGLGRIYSFVLL